MATAAALAKKPDEALKAIIERVQLIAQTTQSVAYHYVTRDEHDGIPEGDVIEIVCAPDPAGRVDAGGDLPEPGEDVHGFIVERDGVLYRCRKPNPGSSDELAWMEIDPDWKDRSVAAKTDARLTAFPGAAVGGGRVELRAGMEAVRERLNELV